MRNCIGERSRIAPILTHAGSAEPMLAAHDGISARTVIPLNA
jgi:hypothetical protein